MGALPRGKSGEKTQPSVFAATQKGALANPAADIPQGGVADLFPFSCARHDNAGLQGTRASSL